MIQQGFSLIELMIVIAIVAILTAVGYPAYQSYMANGYRSTAQADLMGLAAALERHYTTQFSYEGAAESDADTGSPTIFATYSPSTGASADARYNLTIAAVSSDGSSFEIRATPISGTEVDDDGKLYYFSDGRKAWDQNDDSTIADSEYCWSC